MVCVSTLYPTCSCTVDIDYGVTLPLGLAKELINLNMTCRSRSYSKQFLDPSTDSSYWGMMNHKRCFAADQFAQIFAFGSREFDSCASFHAVLPSTGQSCGTMPGQNLEAFLSENWLRFGDK